MTDKTIIEAFDTLWVAFCTNKAEYKDIKDFLLEQLTLAKSRGEEKAIKKIDDKWMTGIPHGEFTLWLESLKQSQDKEDI